jgi:hypothetical protein
MSFMKLSKKNLRDLKGVGSVQVVDCRGIFLVVWVSKVKLNGISGTRATWIRIERRFDGMPIKAVTDSSPA